jgi:hypothetical protein
MANRTVAVISDEIFAVQAEVTALNKKIEGLEKEKARLSTELKAAAEEQGLTSGKGASSSFEIKDQTVPQVSDWDTFVAFAVENGYFHLFYRRPAVKACQELWELGETIPGVNKFTSNKVNVKGV